MKRKRVNLNTLLEEEGRKKPKTCGKIKVHFDNIVSSICRSIRKSDTVYVMGCSAWFTNSEIIRCMSRELRGCCIIVTKDKLLKKKSIQQKYKQLPVYKECAIRMIGSGSGKTKSLMHHKFLVGMDDKGVPLWVSVGSFNLTESATQHLENCMIIRDAEVAKVYLDEFVELYKISKPVVCK